MNKYCNCVDKMNKRRVPALYLVKLDWVRVNFNSVLTVFSIAVTIESLFWEKEENILASTLFVYQEVKQKQKRKTKQSYLT